MAAFHERFIFDASKAKDQRLLWPPEGLPDSEAFENFADVIAVLGAKMAGDTPPSGRKGSFRRRVVDFLAKPDWPDASPVPARYKGHEKLVHLVEMAVISDRMLEAFNAGRGGGGGGSSWPPHV